MAYHHLPFQQSIEGLLFCVCSLKCRGKIQHQYSITANMRLFREAALVIKPINKKTPITRKKYERQQCGKNVLKKPS
jgi:hypothetical protein